MAGRGIVIKIEGEGSSAKQALEMVQQHLKDVREESVRSSEAVTMVKDALAGIGLGLGIAEAVRGIKELVGGAMELGETLEKASKKTGLAVGTLSTLHYAAAITGSDFDGLTSAVAKMDKTIGNASTGNKQAQVAMRELGLNAKDLAGRSDGAEIAFKKLATTIANTENPIVRAKIATDALGKAGAQQIPMLIEVGTHWDMYKQKAQEAGVYLDTEHARILADMAHKMKDIQQKVQGAGVAFTTGLIPGLESMFNVIKGGRGEMSSMEDFGKRVAQGLSLALAAAYGLASGLAKVSAAGYLLTFDKKGAKDANDAADDFARKADAARDFALGQNQHPFERRSEHDAAGAGGGGEAGHIEGLSGKVQSTDQVARAAAALQDEAARQSADSQKAADQIALALLDARHKEELISDKEFYAEKLKLQTDELDAQKTALESKMNTLSALYSKQHSDKTLKRDKSGASAEELNTAKQILQVEDQLGQVEAKRAELRSGAAAEAYAAAQNSELNALRAAAELEKARNSGISAQIALLQKERELEAHKADVNGDPATGANIRALGEIEANKLRIEEINRRITETENETKRAVEELADAAKKDPRYKAAATQQINALNKEEAATLAALVQQYKALADVLGGEYVQKAKDLQTELDKLNRPDNRQEAKFAETLSKGFEGMAESMASAATKGKESFSQMVTSMEADLSKLAVKLALMKLQQIFPNLFGGAGLGGGGGASSAGGSGGGTGMLPGFAGGTDDMRGPAVVGERGPEVWMPPQRGGAIISNSSLAKKLADAGGGGGAPNVNMSIVNNSRQPVTASQPEVDWDSQTRQMVTRIILEDHQSGGPISQVSGGQS